jgi:hypothetical protein
MFDRLQEHFLGEPRRLVSLGAALTRAGGFLLVAGLVGSAATTAVSVAQGMATHSRPEVQVAEVLPMYLSWWMPESAFGFCVALFLMACGVVAARTGRAYQRFGSV